MIDPVNTVGMLFKVLFAFYLFYIFFPSRVIPFEQENNRFLDKFFICLVHSNFVLIIVAHILAFAKVLETLSLVFCYAAIYVLTIWFTKGKSPTVLFDSLGLAFILKILDLSEGEYGLRNVAYKKMLQCKQSVCSCVEDSFKKMFCCPFNGILLLAVFLGAAYVRFHHSLTHLYLGTSDTYLHLAWAKYLARNEIYRDGIYPYGYEAVITVLNKLSFIDTYYIMRFLGPIEGLLMVLSVYYILKRNVKGPHAAWIAVLVYGLFMDIRLPSNVWRQISALPMEYAAVFFLPGLHFFNNYFKQGKPVFLLLAAECAAITLLVHPYVTFFLGVSYLITAAVHYKLFVEPQKLLRISAVMAGSMMVGVLPLLIGSVLGMKFHGSLDYVRYSVQLSNEASSAVNKTFFIENNPVFILFLICTLLLILFWLLVLRKKDSTLINADADIAKVFVFSAVAFYFLYRAHYYNLPQVMDINRVGVFLAMVLVAVVSMTINLFDYLKNNDRFPGLLKIIVCMVLFFIIFSTSPLSRPPQGVKLEYDEAVIAYLKIKDKFPALNWTIISPVEQYQQCLGYGWHYEIWEFIKHIEDNETLKIPTDYVFLYVEKNPLFSKKAIDEQGRDAQFEKTNGDPSQFYYFNAENRHIIQSKAYYWAENFIKNDIRMKVFYDSDVLRVYMIEQDGMNPINLTFSNLY